MSVIMDYNSHNININRNSTIKYKEQYDFKELVINIDYEFVSSNTEDTLDLIIESQALYPTILDPDLWESFLNRSLKKTERKIIHNLLLESDTNLQIKSLYHNLIKNGHYSIPKLTKNNGNCIWESLYYLGYGTPIEIRKNIASLLLLVKNDFNFFPNRDICPEELFINCNDIELVKDKDNNLVYEYDYNMMVMDLYTSHSWTRLPMELILMTISRVYEIEIKIFSNKSSHINTVSVWDIDDIDNINNIDTIYLGHIDEEHYIPVIKIDNNLVHNPILLNELTKFYPRYISAKKEYHNWGYEMTMMRFNTNIDNNIISINVNSELIFDLKEIEDFSKFQVVN